MTAKMGDENDNVDIAAKQSFTFPTINNLKLQLNLLNKKGSNIQGERM